jgi:hypothetical protein
MNYNFLGILIFIFIAWMLTNKNIETFSFDNNLNINEFATLSSNEQDNLYMKKLCYELRQICPKLKKIGLKASPNSSMTVGKQNVYICIRDPKTGNFYHHDILVYVLLHEIAHVITDTYSIKTHDSAFYKNFNFLLKKALEKNILSEIPKVPNDYCGLKK